MESSSTHYFEGTPEEYAVLSRACMEEKGFATGKDVAEDGFMIRLDGRSDEEIQQALGECGEELGEVQMANLSEEELSLRYDARVDQFECLLVNGLIEGEPISFEVFVEQYNRADQQTLWEPTTGAGSLPGQGATDVCPRVGAW